ncbi:MAG: hypothetical protein V1918_03340 [Planctomycetota bacterium]
MKMKYFPAFAFLLFLASAPVMGLEVVEARWGFDGKILPENINLLSLHVSNGSDAPFDGTFRLFQERPFARANAEYVQSCYLSAGASRWIQFHPFIAQENETWVARWDKGTSEEYKFPATKTGPPAVVFLFDPEAIGPMPSMSIFPEELFPSSVSGMDGLHALVLDHMPRRWEPARRKALLEWVYRGGALHILKDGTGNYPKFSGDLAALDTEAERLILGAGEVVRQPIGRTQVSGAYLLMRGFQPPRMRQGENPRFERFDSVVVSCLNDLTRSDHNWTMLYLLAGLYIAAVGPINSWIGRKRADYRQAFLVFLLLVGAFSTAMTIIGRRGYGERSKANTLTLARPVGPGRWDLTQWHNLFVTSGGDYTVTRPGSANYYTAFQEETALGDVIQEEGQGSLTMDIPLFSSRAFFHRGCADGPDLTVRVLEWREDETGLAALRLATSPDFPTEEMRALVYYRDSFYPLRLQDGRLETTTANRVERKQFLGDEEVALLGAEPWARFGARETEKKTEKEVFQKLFKPILARVTGGTDAFPLVVERPRPGRAELFVYAPMPRAFRLDEEKIKGEGGYVLYHMDVWKPER